MNKPKRPQMPEKPIKPYHTKPIPPSKTIKGNATLCKFEFGSYDSVSLNNFMETINSSCPKSNTHQFRYRDDLTIHIEHEEEWGYYDSHTTKTIMTISGEMETENPKYEKEYKIYQKQVEKYNNAKPEHAEKLAKYKQDLEKYNKDMETYLMQQAEYDVWWWKRRANQAEERLMKKKAK